MFDLITIRWQSGRLAPRFRRDGTPGTLAPSAVTTTPATPATPSTTTPAASSPAATTPASQTGTPAPAVTPPSDDIENGNWKQLRTKYDETKARAAILDTLGLDDTSTLPDIVATYKAIHTEAHGLAKELGYDEEDFKTAFKANPAKTLELLRADKAEAAATPPPKPGESTADYDARIKAEVEKQTGPLKNHINQQVTKAVLERVGTEIKSSLATALPGAPPEVHELVTDYVEEYLAHNNSALVAMKARQDFSSVDETVKFVAGRLTSVFAKWVQAETARTGGRPATSTAASPTAPGIARKDGKMPFTIDQLIEDPGLMGDQYK